MSVIDTLKKHLEQIGSSLSVHRIDLVSRLIQGLLVCRSANLMKVATAMPGPAKKMSRYRRLQRFFSSGLSPHLFSQWIVQRLLLSDRLSLLTVTMDRTHWMFGQTHENILCLGLLFAGISIPLESMALGKAGNTNTQERCDLFLRAWMYLKDYSCCLLADREFIGAEWFRFLLEQTGLDFIIRIRENCWVTLPNGQQRDLGILVRYMPKGRTWTYENVLLYDQERTVRINLVCHRSREGEYVLLVTNRTDLKEALKLYSKRWSIETAFSYLKSKGFDLEATHLSHPQRIPLLISILAVCLLWCVLVGLEKQREKPIAIKKHGRKTISLVRLGLDTLQETILNFPEKWKPFRHYCRLLLSCT